MLIKNISFWLIRAFRCIVFSSVMLSLSMVPPVSMFPIDSKKLLVSRYKLLQKASQSGGYFEVTKLGYSQLNPRCTKSDDFGSKRHKRFVTAGLKWPFTSLSWKFRDPYKLFKKRKDFKVVHSTIRRALEMWSEASNGTLKFSDRSGSVDSVDLDIFFARYDHGDHEPFDGKGGIVAHSGYPMEGKVHFDASESWTVHGKGGVDFRYVALHELGHALGLRHSENQDAIMHPIYRKSSADLGLTADDIIGIQFLYRDHTHEERT